MAVSDIAAARRCLERVGYYRLSGYWYSLRKSEVVINGSGASEKIILDDFRPDTLFSQVSDLYVFDKKLRQLMMDAIERVEIAVRVKIAALLGPRNPIAHLDGNELHGKFSKKINPKTEITEHQRWIKRFNDLKIQSKAEFVSHFKINYPDSELPIWIAIEIWDFGATSFFLSGMKHADQIEISEYFGIPRRELLLGWVRSINSIRNACAHHSRLWNHPLIDNPTFPKLGESALLDHLSSNFHAHTRLYTVAVALQFFLRQINPNSTWSTRLKELCEQFPSSEIISMKSSGFPDEWKDLEIWN